MAEKNQVFTQEFKLGVVKYALDHPDETNVEIGKRFGIHDKNVANWKKRYKETSGEVEGRGSGNYSSEEAKEIARLKRELKNTQDALEVLKKAIGILGR